MTYQSTTKSTELKKTTRRTRHAIGIMWLLVIFGIFSARTLAVDVSFRGGVAVSSGLSQYKVTVNGVTAISPLHSSSCWAGVDTSEGRVSLDIGQVYEGRVELITGLEFCSGVVWFFGYSLAGCYDLYIDGENNDNSFDFYDPPPPGDTVQTFSVELRPKKILFTWDVPKKDGIYTIGADGYTQATPSATDSNVLVSSFLWTIQGDSLGSTIATNTGVVTASTNTGTIKVRAVDNQGTCHEERLDLVSCEDCQSGTCAGFGNLGVANGSVDVKVGLGWSGSASTAGYLQIRESFPTNTIATPQALQYRFIRSDTEKITNAQGLRQVKSREGLANIITNSSSSYSIQMYSSTNVLAKDANGIYQLTNSAIRTITIENPGGDTNQVRVSDSYNGSVFDYTWITNGWQLVSGGGLRTENKTIIWSETNTLRTVTTTIQLGTNTPVFQKVEKFRTASYGERLVEEVVGTGANALTNSYTYTANGFVQQAVHSDGAWEYYLYDSQNRPTNVFSSFLNQGVTTNMNLCRLIEHDYSTNVVSGSGDGGYINTTSPRRTIEYLLGSEIRRTYHVVLPGERREIQCTTAGAAWTNANNLVTVTKVFTNGFHFNEVQSVLRPDGTTDIYQYGIIATNTTNIVLSGHPDGTGTNIDQGTRTITILGPMGQILSRTVVDVQSGITTGNDNYQYDSLNRLTETVHMGGTSEQITYDCCTISSTRDHDGTLTTYSYDALKRLLTTTRNAITLSNVYDPSGNILSTVRFGTNSSAVTNYIATYDNAGRQVMLKNALNNPTSFTNYFDGSGQLIKITTYADGGTRVETHYKDGSLSKLTGTAVRPVRYTNGVESEGGANRFFSHEIKLDSAGSDTSESTKIYYDMLKRPYKTLYSAASGSPSSQSLYNNLGQLVGQVDPDAVTNLSGYNVMGELEFTATDLNNNQQIDTNAMDRVSQTISDVTTNSTYGAYVRRVRTYAWSTNDSGNATLVSTLETSTDGLRTWTTVQRDASTPVVSKSHTVYAGSGTRYVTNTAPDGSYTLTVYSSGRLTSMTHYNSSGSQIANTTHGYDEHDRIKTVTDARNGATTYSYNIADQITSVTTPAPGTGQAPQATITYYDSMSRATNTVFADGTSVTNDYYLTGELKRTYGSRTYPVGYGYDPQGRMTKMTNWTTFPSLGERVTTWSYNPYRGWLEKKVYAGETDATTDYEYTAAGRLWKWHLEGGVSTTYDYNFAGDLQTIDYSDSTPDVSYGYDRRGRQNSITHGTATTALTYNDANQLLSQTNSAGTLAGLWLTNTYDAHLRRTALSAQNASTSLVQHSFAFDNASRLTNVTDGAYSAGYTYLANSPLVSQITLKSNTTTQMTTSKQYDYLNRLLSISSAPSASGQLPIAFGYQYNDGNQRTRVTLNDGSLWIYGYDKLGQLTSGKRYWSDGTPVAGQQFEYGLDEIGNRSSTKVGGDASGTGLRSATYTASSLNQYSSRTVPDKVDIVGIANTSASVTMNSSAADYRRGEYFQELLTVANSSNPVWQNVSITTSGGGSESGNLYVPKATETYGQDLDGNLTNDGRWSFTWDAENRLIKMEPSGTVTVPDGAKRKLEFSYDHQGRRIQKTVHIWTNSAWSLVLSNKFLYDGWNLLAELNATNNAVIRSYLWGLDLSGTPQGAGGVGGLLVANMAGSGGQFVGYDGNGNVSGLYDPGTTNWSAKYEYGPFGEIIRAPAQWTKTNPFRFSTKYQDDESDLLYYGYRYYNPSTGSWLSRDPIGEEGGLHLYAFVNNDPVLMTDGLGLAGGVAPVLPQSVQNCCTDSDVQKGERELNSHFASAKQKLAGLGITPAPMGKPGATCITSSTDIIRWLAPFPKCWQCYLEIREYVLLGRKWADHQVIICAAYSNGTKKKEIMFDWWGDTKNNVSQSGGPPDPFRKQYPDNPWVTSDQYNQCTRDCAGNPVRPDLPGYPVPGKHPFRSIMGY